MLVDELVERFAAGYRPRFVYVIPEYQNPSGRTLSLARRHALVDACRRYGVLIFEDVAYRELAFDGEPLPSLWSLGPDVVLQAGTFSKIFSPGFRLGWAVGPASIVALLADFKQNTDQCSGALGQRMVEEYGRAGHFDTGVPRARALYASHWAALSASLDGPHAGRLHLERADGRDVHLGHAARRTSTRASCARPRPRPASPTSPAARSMSATTVTTRCGSRSATSTRGSSSSPGGGSRACSSARWSGARA